MRAIESTKMLNPLTLTIFYKRFRSEYGQNGDKPKRRREQEEFIANDKTVAKMQSSLVRYPMFGSIRPKR